MYILPFGAQMTELERLPDDRSKPHLAPKSQTENLQIQDDAGCRGLDWNKRNQHQRHQHGGIESEPGEQVAATISPHRCSRLYAR